MKHSLEASRAHLNKQKKRSWTWNYPVWGVEGKTNEYEWKWKWASGTSGTSPGHTHHTRSREEREQDRKNIWRNNAPKVPRSEETHEYTRSRSSMNSKRDKLKEKHTKTRDSQPTETQRQGWNLESSKREANHTQRILNKMKTWFPPKTHESQKAVGWHI